MNDIDTDIDNYSYEELLALLQLTKENCSKEKLLNKVEDIIDVIENQDNEEIEGNYKIELIDFFKKCFIRISVVNNYDVTNNINTLNIINANKSTKKSSLINTIREDTDKYLNEIGDDLKKSLIKPDGYEGSVPNPITNPITNSNDINSNSNNNVYQTYNTSYVRGTVNPLKRESIKTILTLNSKFRLNANYNGGNTGTPTDFTIELEEPYNNVVALKLASVELINSYYPISDYLKTNEFTITTFDYDPSAANPSTTKANIIDNKISLTEGDYTVTQVVSILNSIFNDSSNVALNAIQILYYTIKGKIVISLKNTPPTAPPSGRAYGFDLKFSIDSEPERPIYLNLGWLLGYRNKIYDFFVDYNQTTNTIQELGFNPEAFINLKGTTNYLLEINDFNNNNPKVFNYNCNSYYSFNINNILAKIPNTENATTLIFEDSSDRIFKERVYFGPVRIKKIRIRLLDDNGRLVNLNNGELIVSLEITSLDVPYKNMVH